MDPEMVNQLLGWIEPLFSQEKLYDLRIVDFPSLKQEARNKIHKGLYKAANPSIMEVEERPLTTADIGRLVSGV